MNERESDPSAAMGERLSRYLDGELSPAEVAEVERLLETSVEAREMYQMLQEIHALSSTALPRILFSRNKLHQSRRWPVRRVAAAAVILAAVLGGLSYAAVETYQAYFAPAPESQAGVAPTHEVPDPGVLAAAPQPSSDPDQTRAIQMAANESPGAAVPPAAPAATTDGAAPELLTGHVVDTKGQPIADAEVRAVGLPQDALARRHTSKRAILARAQTDADGRFQLAWPAAAYLARVVAPGYADVEGGYTGQVRGAAVALHAQLERAPVVTGHVTDEQGRPLPAVRVIPQAALDSARDTVLTDDAGAFSIATDKETLFFQHPDYAIGLVEKFAKNAPVNVKLGRGGTVRVHVVRGGAPVAGAVVTSPLNLPTALDYAVARRADAQGLVVYENVPTFASFALSAFTDDGAAAIAEGGEVNVRAGETTECLIELPARYPGLLQGRILDARGDPVAGADITVRPAEPNSQAPKQTVASQQDGTFQVGLNYGVAQVSVRRLDTREEVVDGQEERLIEVKAHGAKFHEEFRYKVTERTTISIHDEAGAAVKMAWVNVGPSLTLSTNGCKASTFIVTSAEGEFDLPRAERMRAWAYDPSSRRAGWASSEEPPARLDLVLANGMGAIAARVTDPEGCPLANANVIAGCGATDGSGLASARTDAEGLARLEPLPVANVYAVMAELTGYRLQRGHVARPAPEPELTTIVLAPVSAAVSGSVTAIDGTPATNATVYIADASPMQLPVARTDSQGAFAAEVVAGPCTIYAYARPFLLSEAQTVTAPAQGLHLVLPIDTMPPERAVEVPTGLEHQKASERVRQMGQVFKMFAHKAKGEKFPPMEPEQGKFLPELRAIYPEFLTDKDVLFGDKKVSLCYFGYAITSEENGQAFLDAYESLGAEAIYDQDIQVQPGKGTAGTNTLYRLGEGIGRVLLGNAAPADTDLWVELTAQADIPVMWEVPGDRAESGGWVVFMDGHTEWVPYPGPFPMTETFIARLRQAMGLPATE